MPEDGLRNADEDKKEKGVVENNFIISYAHGTKSRNGGLSED